MFAYILTKNKSQALISFNTRSDPYMLIWSVCLLVPRHTERKGSPEAHWVSHVHTCMNTHTGWWLYLPSLICFQSIIISSFALLVRIYRLHCFVLIKWTLTKWRSSLRTLQRKKECVEDNTNPSKQQENGSVPNLIYAYYQIYYDVRNKDHLIRSDNKLAKTNLEIIKRTVPFSPLVFTISHTLSVY